MYNEFNYCDQLLSFLWVVSDKKIQQPVKQFAYRVALNFCKSLFLQIEDLRTNFCNCEGLVFLAGFLAGTFSADHEKNCKI